MFSAFFLRLKGLSRPRPGPEALRDNQSKQHQANAVCRRHGQGIFAQFDQDLFSRACNAARRRRLISVRVRISTNVKNSSENPIIDR